MHTLTCRFWPTIFVFVLLKILLTYFYLNSKVG